jgi:phosphoribosylamine--glycine ligase
LKILVIGRGGREHALCWKLKQSPRATAVFCAPGNAGTALDVQNVAIEPGDQRGLVQFARKEGISLTVVGPEEPLSKGIVDVFQREGLRIFGPRKDAAELEGSKVFAKLGAGRRALHLVARGCPDRALAWSIDHSAHAALSDGR